MEARIGKQWCRGNKRLLPIVHLKDVRTTPRRLPGCDDREQCPPEKRIGYDLRIGRTYRFSDLEHYVTALVDCTGSDSEGYVPRRFAVADDANRCVARGRFGLIIVVADNILFDDP